MLATRAIYSPYIVLIIQSIVLFLASFAIISLWVNYNDHHDLYDKFGLLWAFFTLIVYNLQSFSEQYGYYLNNLLIEELDSLSKEKDLKIIKILHDVQNPVQAINLVLDDSESLANKDDYLDDIKTNIILEMNSIQNTLNSIRCEMKMRRKMTNNEQLSLVSVSNFISTIIKNNLVLARNGCNKIRLDILENSILNKCKLRRMSVELLLMNILILNLKNMNNGIIGISLAKDDFDQDTTNCNLVSVGSQRNENHDYFLITIINSSIVLNIEQQTLMDVFTFNTYIHLCSQSGIILRYNYTFDVCKLYIPFQRVHNSNSYCNYTNLIYEDKSVTTQNELNEHECGTAIIVEDNLNILNFYGRIMTTEGINYKLFSNGKYAYEYISSITCNKCNRILVYTDMSMPYTDGLQLANKLKELNNGFIYKIVLISAHVMSDYQYMFDEIYEKPITRNRFIEIYNETYNMANDDQL